MASSNKRPLVEPPPGSNKSAKIHPFFTAKQASAATHSSSGHLKWLKPLGGTCLHAVNLVPQSRSKLALFDLDDTLIKPDDSARKWDWWTRSIPDKLNELHQEGFSIVLISNQAGLARKSSKSPKALDWQQVKIPSIAAAIPDLPFRLLAATAKDGFRKPMIGMWTELERIYKEDDIDIDKAASFVVGDAAGRPASDGRKKDFAGTDRMWAANVGITFHTPEEYFLSVPPQPYKLEGFHVSSLAKLPLFAPDSSPLLPKPLKQEIILFVGYPALGKTSFYHKHLEPAEYVHINQDILKTRAKCIKTVQEVLQNNRSCVVDNTNRNIATRKFYVDVAKGLKVDIRCFHFTGSRDLAWHNNLYRAYNLPPSLVDSGPKRDVLPQVAFASFDKEFEEPTLAEGFTEVREINWVFQGTEEQEKYWSMWTWV
ncbi:polynucleotide kinase 3 phosphatase-domain-containing protein [Mycena floridula]|nr:polynucleotide kinase 3 phosphatase-domain-containing protein [Mycena floridula]